VEMGEANVAIPAVIKLLDSKSKGVRASAATTLGKFGAAAKPAVAKLKDLAKNGVNEGIRKAAAEAVEKITSGKPAEISKGKPGAKKKRK